MPDAEQTVNIEVQVAHSPTRGDSQKGVRRRKNVEEQESPKTPESPQPKQAPAVNRRARPRQKLNDLDLEVLILAVQNKIPLWDYTIPLDQRSREITRGLWDQVSAELNGKLSAQDAKKKFKSMRDCYRKIIHAEQNARGSARSAKEKWKFYHMMEFLRDSCLIRANRSNITTTHQSEENDFKEEDEDDNADDVSISNDNKQETARRDFKSFNPASNASNKVTAVICNASPNPLRLPSQLDEVDLMLSAAGLQLKRMPHAIKMQTLLDIMNLVHSRSQ